MVKFSEGIKRLIRNCNEEMLLRNIPTYDGIEGALECALFFSCEKNFVKSCEMILSRHKKLINIYDAETKQNLFAIACDYKSNDVVKWLVGHGVDINKVDNDGETGLHYAIDDTNEDLVKFLATRYDKKHISDALEYACDYGFFWAVEILCENHPDIDLNERPYLYRSVLAGNLETVQFLISNGVNVNQQTPVFGRTALMTACSECDEQYGWIIGALIKSNADLNLQDVNGDTALIIAAENQCYDAIVTLMGCEGIDLTIKNNKGDDFRSTCNKSGSLGIKALCEPVVATPVDDIPQYEGESLPKSTAKQVGNVYATMVTPPKPKWWFVDHTPKEITVRPTYGVVVEDARVRRAIARKRDGTTYFGGSKRLKRTSKKGRKKLRTFKKR